MRAEREYSLPLASGSNASTLHRFIPSPSEARASPGSGLWTIITPPLAAATIFRHACPSREWVSPPGSRIRRTEPASEEQNFRRLDEVADPRLWRHGRVARPETDALIAVESDAEHSGLIRCSRSRDSTDRLIEESPRSSRTSRACPTPGKEPRRTKKTRSQLRRSRRSTGSVDRARRGRAAARVGTPIERFSSGCGDPKDRLLA